MHRDRGPISCVATEAIDKGTRVRLVSTPVGAIHELPYVEIAADYLGTSPYIGVTDRTCAAGEIIAVHPVFSDIVEVKVATDRTLYSGNPIYAAQSGIFTTDDGGDHVKCGYVVTPGISVPTGKTTYVQAILTRWTYDA